jgi:hypothetical protein
MGYGLWTIGDGLWGCRLSENAQLRHAPILKSLFPGNLNLEP